MAAHRQPYLCPHARRTPGYVLQARSSRVRRARRRGDRPSHPRPRPDGRRPHGESSIAHAVLRTGAIFLDASARWWLLPFNDVVRSGDFAGWTNAFQGRRPTPSSGTASSILGRRWRNLLHSHSPSCCPLGWPSASTRSLALSIRAQGEQVGNSQGDDGCCVLAMHHAAREHVLPVITAVNDPLCIC